MEDYKGNIWVGTQKHGLLKVQSHKLEAAKTSADFPKSVYTIDEMGPDELLVGGDDGLFLASTKNNQVRIIRKIFSEAVRSVKVRANQEILVNSLFLHQENQW